MKSTCLMIFAALLICAPSQAQDESKSVERAGEPESLHRFIKDSEDIRDRMNSNFAPRSGVEQHRITDEFQKEIDQPEIIVEQIPGDTTGQVIKKVNDMRYQVYEDQPFEKVGSVYRPIPTDKYNLSKIQNVEKRLDTIEGKLDSILEKMTGSPKNETS